MLSATGPITVDGTALTADNAVSVLLADVYRRWDASTAAGSATVRDCFAKVSDEALRKISSGASQPSALVAAVGESIRTGSILFFSDDEQLAPLLAGQTVVDVLPTASRVSLRWASSSATGRYRSSAPSGVVRGGQRDLP